MADAIYETNPGLSVNVDAFFMIEKNFDSLDIFLIYCMKQSILGLNLRKQPLLENARQSGLSGSPHNPIIFDRKAKYYY